MKTELPPAEAEVAENRAPLWATVAATFFGIGRLRPGPGTWASLAAVLIWLGMSRFIQPAWQTLDLAVMALVAIVIGIPAATATAKASGVKDPQFVVIDEVEIGRASCRERW